MLLNRNVECGSAHSFFHHPLPFCLSLCFADPWPMRPISGPSSTSLQPKTLMVLHSSTPGYLLSFAFHPMPVYPQYSAQAPQLCLDRCSILCKISKSWLKYLPHSTALNLSEAKDRETSERLSKILWEKKQAVAELFQTDIQLAQLVNISWRHTLPNQSNYFSKSGNSVASLRNMLAGLKTERKIKRVREIMVALNKIGKWNHA